MPGKKTKKVDGKRRFPAVTGPQLARLLEKDGWQGGRMATHGRVYTKLVDGRTLVTILPVRSDPLPDGTLGAILGTKQTRIGKDGLRKLIEEHGL